MSAESARTSSAQSVASAIVPDASAELSDRLVDGLQRVNARLDVVVDHDSPLVREASHHLVDAGGKRFRPMLTLLTSMLGTGISDEVVDAAAGVELTHLASLYHDDVMDEAATRRTVDSVNFRWGNLKAILGGDFLLAKASEIAASLGTEVAGLLAATIARLLDTVGLAARRHALAGVLSHGEKQWLEIGMVLVQDPKLLLLDEPVAGLSERETARTAELVRSLRGPGRSIVVVEHDMDFVEQVADQVTVLHEGRTLFDGSMADARADARVIEVYIGR